MPISSSPGFFSRDLNAPGAFALLSKLKGGRGFRGMPYSSTERAARAAAVVSVGFRALGAMVEAERVALRAREAREERRATAAARGTRGAIRAIDQRRSQQPSSVEVEQVGRERAALGRRRRKSLRLWSVPDCCGRAEGAARRRQAWLFRLYCSPQHRRHSAPLTPSATSPSASRDDGRRARARRSTSHP